MKLRVSLPSGLVVVAIGLMTSMAACGVGQTQSSSAATPSVVRIEPVSAKRGESVTLYGSFFSESEDNIVFIGGIAVVSTDWDVAATGNDGEAEQVVFTVPDSATTGDQSVFVMSGDETSNAVSFTVED